MTVFILTIVTEDNTHEIFGVYSTRAKAEAAQKRLGWDDAVISWKMVDVDDEADADAA